MSNGIFGIGISGLQAAQAGLLTTSHNISNATTPGYTRQEVTQGTRSAKFTGSGFIGQGVDVTDVRRIYSQFLVSQALHAQSAATHLDTYSTELAALSTIFGDSSSGLAPALTDFFAGVNTVAANPSDVPSRQSMLSSSTALVVRFQQLQQQLEETRDGINAQITTSVATINSLATSIADLNKRIVGGYASMSGLHAPNDLIDQRDALMTQLNGQLGTTSIAQSDGSLNVFLPNGQALVVGLQSYELTAGASESDPRNLDVGLKVSATVSQFHALGLTGGALGGLLAYRDGVLGEAENSLGRTALVIAHSFNDQHKLGIDLTGQPGGDFFIAPAGRVQPALSNTGTGAIAASVVDVSALTTSDYELVFDGTSYSLTRLSDDTTQTFATLPQTVDGFTLSLASGTPAAGDRFLIQPTRYAAGDIGLAISDPKKIAAAAPVRIDATLGNAGTASVSSTSVDASYLAAPLTGSLTLTFDSSSGTLTGFPAAQQVTVSVGTTTTTYPAATPVPYTAGATISFGGITFTLSGSPANVDTFTIAPNSGGVGDNRNALLLAGLQSKNIADHNTTTIGGTYARMVSSIATTAHQANIEATAQDSILTNAQQAVQTVSGVNLDEEAANLQRYQQAYQAAGKVLAIAASLFDTILEITNG